MAYIKIDKEAFAFNLKAIAKQTGSLDKIAIVLKDNAYGHGLLLMAQLSSSLGIKHAVVKNLAEAKEIRECFKTILILNDKAIYDSKYFFAINSLQDIKNTQKHSNIELKIDTGMGRNGIAISEFDEAIDLIKEKRLHLRGVMTHFRSSDVLSSEFFWQYKKFESIKTRIKNLGYVNIRFHSHNSSAILRSKKFNDDLVRVGIGLYGYNELDKAFESIKLKPILSLYAQKTTSRKIKKGERLGYGGDFIAPHSMSVSCYAMGYGDGWQRTFSSTQFHQILGRVSMDFILLNTSKPEVCIFDNAQTIANKFDTISYEVLTSLSKDINRIVL